MGPKASRDTEIVIPRFGHYDNFASTVGAAFNMRVIWGLTHFWSQSQVAIQGTAVFGTFSAPWSQTIPAAAIHEHENV